MRPSRHWIQHSLVIAFAAWLSACGSSSSSNGDDGDQPVDVDGTVTTLAGSTQGLTDGTGTTAQFSFPENAVADGANLYVSDTGNSVIRKIDTDSAAVTTLAGSGFQGFLNGPAAAAQFDLPRGIATDGFFSYVADSANNVIRKVNNSTGFVSTLAGSELGIAGSNDGTSKYARFDQPWGVASDGIYLYVADANNHRIRQVLIISGGVSTLAGSSSGFADGTGSAAQFQSPRDVTEVDGNLYVADTLNNRIRRVVIGSGEVTTFAGGAEGFADGIGTAAQFSMPAGIDSDGTDLFVTDTGNNRIRRISIATREVTTLAGSDDSGSTDGSGVDARFNRPRGIALGNGSVYIVDTDNHRIRRID